MPSDTCLQRVWPGGPPCDLAPGHPGQHHGGWSSVAHRLADELTAAHPADPDDVRAARVPWPGQADDGTCSCCGMPFPCVARRLADEVEELRRRAPSGRRHDLEYMAAGALTAALLVDRNVDSVHVPTGADGVITGALHVRILDAWFELTPTLLPADYRPTPSPAGGTT